MTPRAAIAWVVFTVLCAITAIEWDSPSETDSYRRDQQNLSDARITARLSANNSKGTK